jgi:hypothetical protein
VGRMKFRYAASVQRSLIENQAMLDVSQQLTRINCAIGEMQQVDTSRGEVQRDELERMMHEQAFDAARRDRWRSYLDGPLS